MQTSIESGPAFAIARVRLGPGESVVSEAGAMVSMQGGVEVQTASRGGLMAGLKRSMLGGTSFFMNTFVAGQGGEVTFAPQLPGDIVAWELSGQTVYLTSGSYLASAATIDVDTKWGGAKTFFSREGLFLLKVSGTGTLLVASYGALTPVQLGAGEVLTVDSGHVVAFGGDVGYSVHKFGGWKSTLLGGEGLVVRLEGPGQAYVQTRSQEGFVDWLVPLLPKQTST